MDYQRIYNEFIADRREKEKTLTGYTEKHHIVPRSHGGDNSKKNIIKLTAQDHYFAHELLARIHGGGMWRALWMMSTSTRYKVSRIAYKKSREKQVEFCGSLAKTHLVGRKKTKDEINKISSSLKKHFAENGNPCKGRPMSDEQKEKLSKLMKLRYRDKCGPMSGKNHKPESINKLRNYMLSDKNHFRGKPLSDEHKRKISEAQIGSMNHAYKPQLYRFYNESYGEFIGSQNDLIKKFMLAKSNVSRLCLGKVKTSKGWVILEKLDA